MSTLTKNVRVKDQNGVNMEWTGSYWHIRNQTVVKLTDGSFCVVGDIKYQSSERHVVIEKNLGKVEFNDLDNLLA